MSTFEQIKSDWEKLSEAEKIAEAQRLNETLTPEVMAYTDYQPEVTEAITEMLILARLGTIKR